MLQIISEPVIGSNDFRWPHILQNAPWEALNGVAPFFGGSGPTKLIHTFSQLFKLFRDCMERSKQ